MTTHVCGVRFTTVMDGLGQRIRNAREAAGLPREKMAPRIGVSLSTLARYESGESDRIPLAAVLKIAEETGQPLSYFLAGDEASA